ncbi:protein argonaute 2-like [Nomascus leucogenys]|uniref:protein argonaute 2-like n=1 Tax=Nomascus leucogenys TaxID=61853 RepID=UPI00122D8DFB|nr:protein argonaute 2-like [Nomascus leucogenys]
MEADCSSASEITICPGGGRGCPRRAPEPGCGVGVRGARGWSGAGGGKARAEGVGGGEGAGEGGEGAGGSGVEPGPQRLPLALRCSRRCRRCSWLGDAGGRSERLWCLRLLLSSGARGCGAPGPGPCPGVSRVPEPRPGVPRPAGENALSCSSRPGLAPPGHEEGPVRRARSREEEEGGGRPRRRAREAENAAAAAADAATRGPSATLTPDPRMEPALGAAAAPGAPPTSQARSLASPEAWKDSVGS